MLIDADSVPLFAVFDVVVKVGATHAEGGEEVAGAARSVGSEGQPRIWATTSTCCCWCWCCTNCTNEKLKIINQH